MTFQTDLPAKVAASVVALCWLAFGVILVVGKKGASASTTKRDLMSHAGFLAQMLGYAILLVWNPTYSPALGRGSRAAETLISLFAALLAIASTWFCFAAARALGKQWALVARVIEGHELIRQGPYAVVRNPIYLAMLGMLLATGLAASRWQAVAAATFVFLIGTEIRIRSEEKLLKEKFGPEFDEYAREVPTLIPRIF